MNKKTMPRPWFFPRPVLLLSTRDKAGHDNIITISWAGVACTKPPMVTVSLRKSRHSHAIISSTKEFVANIPTAKQMHIAEVCGTTSGKDTDKFASLGLDKHSASIVSAPLVADCPINLECQVRQILQLGSHDLFVAEVVKVHAHHGLLRDDGEINDEALDCLAWGSEEFFRVLRPSKHSSVARFL
jgi:flavin reductase (DIM6/NTAB) family NADH-FMN oxidoreductase RutF